MSPSVHPSRGPGYHQRKRKAEHDSSNDNTNTSSNTSLPRKHKNRPTPFPGGNARPKKHAIHPLKHQIRDLERLITNSSSHQNASITLLNERKLAALRHELVLTKASREKTRMIEKYHMVRFFERKKAERHLKKAIKAQVEYDGGDDDDVAERERLARKVHIATIDLNYTNYSPLDSVYVSLYPNQKSESDGKMRVDDEAVEEGMRGDVDMWRRVERATAEGRLDALRNGLDLERARASLAFRPKGKGKSGGEGGLGRKTGGKEDGDVEMESDHSKGGVRLDAAGSDDDDGFFE